MLGTWWVEAARMDEGRRRLEQALDRHRDAPPQVSVPADALVGLLAWYQGDGRAARVALQRVIGGPGSGFGTLDTMARLCFAFIDGRFHEAEVAACELLEATRDRQRTRLVALFMAGNVAHYAGRDELALDRYLELRSLAETVADPYQIALAVRFQAMATALCADVDRGWALAERGLALAAEEGSLVGRTQAEAILALVAHRAGDLASAFEHALEATRLSRASLDGFSLRVAVPVLAACLEDRGATRVAATAIGWLMHLIEDSQLVLAPVPTALIDETLTRLDARLGEADRRRIVARAAALELRDLVEHVRKAR